MLRLFIFLSFFGAVPFVSAQSTSDENTLPPVVVQSQTSAKVWLNKLRDLVKTQNFEASFVLYRLGDETVPYLWRHGVMEDGTSMEQLSLQNGPGREIIRVGQRVSVFEPDVPPYSVSRSSINGPIPWALLQNEPMLYEGYEFVVVGRSRVSGRSAKQIRIVSLDNTRFSYQLWLDEQTAMLLKLNMLDDQGTLIEQIQMSTFRLTEKPHPYFSRVNKTKLPRMVALPPSQADKLDWDVSFLPVGMREVKQDTRRLAVTGQRVEYRLYSDGLIDVSVYVAPSEQSLNKDLLLRHDLSTFLSRDVSGIQVTVIGEIPPETANSIAQSLVSKN